MNPPVFTEIVKWGKKSAVDTRAAAKPEYKFGQKVLPSQHLQRGTIDCRAREMSTLQQIEKLPVALLRKP